MKLTGVLDRRKELTGDLANRRSLNGSVREGVRWRGTDDYTQLRNLPTLNGEEIIGDKSFEDYGEQTITNTELQNIINTQYNLIFGGGSNA